jgi:dephospho-CoA kinase
MAGMKTVAVGITGGIGSGKSEICRVFESLGAVVFSADAIARNIINTNPAVRSRLQRLFGSDLYLPDGSLNRKQMARIIFTDTAAQEKVNAIVHPFVTDFLREAITAEQKKGTAPVVAVEAALIFEAKIEDLFEYIIVADADEDERIRRVVARDGSTPADVRDRMKSQMPPGRKADLADFVIHNAGDKVKLEERSRFVFQLLRTIARTS